MNSAKTEYDFTTRKKRPPVSEFLDESLENVLIRMANNPSGNQSEDAFVAKIIDYKIAVEVQKTNEKLVRATRAMVWATIIINAIILVVNIFYNPRPTIKHLNPPKQTSISETVVISR